MLVSKYLVVCIPDFQIIFATSLIMFTLGVLVNTINLQSVKCQLNIGIG